MLVLLVPVAILLVAAVWVLLVRRCNWCGGFGWRHGHRCNDCGKPWAGR